MRLATQRHIPRLMVYAFTFDLIALNLIKIIDNTWDALELNLGIWENITVDVARLLIPGQLPR